MYIHNVVLIKKPSKGIVKLAGKQVYYIGP